MNKILASNSAALWEIAMVFCSFSFCLSSILSWKHCHCSCRIITHNGINGKTLDIIIKILNRWCSHWHGSSSVRIFYLPFPWPNFLTSNSSSIPMWFENATGISVHDSGRKCVLFTWLIVPLMLLYRSFHRARAKGCAVTFFSSLTCESHRGAAWMVSQPRAV